MESSQAHDNKDIAEIWKLKSEILAAVPSTLAALAYFCSHRQSIVDAGSICIFGYLSTYPMYEILKDCGYTNKHAYQKCLYFGLSVSCNIMLSLFCIDNIIISKQIDNKKNNQLDCAAYVYALRQEIDHRLSAKQESIISSMKNTFVNFDLHIDQVVYCGDKHVGSITATLFVRDCSQNINENEKKSFQQKLLTICEQDGLHVTKVEEKQATGVNLIGYLYNISFQISFENNCFNDDKINHIGQQNEVGRHIQILQYPVHPTTSVIGKITANSRCRNWAAPVIGLSTMFGLFAGLSRNYHQQVEPLSTDVSLFAALGGFFGAMSVSIVSAFLDGSSFTAAASSINPKHLH